MLKTRFLFESISSDTTLHLVKAVQVGITNYGVEPAYINGSLIPGTTTGQYASITLGSGNHETNQKLNIQFTGTGRKDLSIIIEQIDDCEPNE